MLFWCVTISMAFRPVARLLTRGLISIVTILGLCQPDCQPGVCQSGFANQSANTVPNSGLPPGSRIIDDTLIEGTYDYHSSENFDAYLEELGVPWYLRELAGMAAPTVKISKRHKNCPSQHKVHTVTAHGSALYLPSKCPTLWTIRTETLFKSHEISFSLNQTVSDTTMDGRRIKMVVTQPGSNQWKEVQSSLETGKETTLIRNFLYDKMEIEMFVGNIKSSSTFIRHNENS